MAAEYRKIEAGSYDEAVEQLQPGEQLVVSGPNSDDEPEKGHVPVTSDRSFRIMTQNGSPPGEPFARKP